MIIIKRRLRGRRLRLPCLTFAKSLRVILRRSRRSSRRRPLLSWGRRRVSPLILSGCCRG